MTITTMETRRQPVEGTVETIALTETSWRVCNGELPDDDARRLVAYVEETGPAAFEVLWMWPRPGQCDVFETLDAALEAIANRLFQRRSFPGAS